MALSISEAGRKLRAGEVTSVALTEQALSLVAQTQPALHAFITVTGERAMADARRIAIGGLSDGHCDTAAWCWLDSPFRSWRSIRLGGVSQDDAGCRLSGFDEPQGRLL